MQIGPSLQLRQTQRLSMTPQLRQALKLLQMNQHDLLTELRDVLDKNPLLQADEDLPEPTRGPVQTATIQSGPSGGDANIDSLPSAPISLPDFVISQLGMANAPISQVEIACHLAQELEPDGYLRAPLSEIAARLNKPIADIEAALRLVQTCEPSGVGARHLAECLGLQLAEQGALDEAMVAILGHLDLVAAGDDAALEDISGLDELELAAALAKLRTLNPRPGTSFEPDQSPIVVPEVIVRRDTFGQWTCELNPETLPKISVNQSYVSALGRKSLAKDKMSNQWMDQAQWLLRALQQRAANIHAVASAIVEHQARFFEFGAEQMRPLALREIAEKTALHESTISRTVNGKYLTCRAGTFELRYFFTASLAATKGDERFGASAIRARIKRLIDEENQKKPLSDDELVKILRAERVDIARRTIAKYRRAMGISSSVQRRRSYSTAKRLNG